MFQYVLKTLGLLTGLDWTTSPVQSSPVQVKFAVQWTGPLNTNNEEGEHIIIRLLRDRL